MQSLWSKTIQLPRRESLQGDISVENVVIGAGLAGLLTAYFLQKKGKQVIVLEAARIAGGQTQNTTAKLTSQHGLIYDEMIKKAGKDRAMGYAMANESAVNAYEKLIKEEGISCDFERLPSFLYTTNPSEVHKLRQEAQAAAALGLPAHFMEQDGKKELPFAVEGAVCFENQAQFHPLKLIQALAPKLTIYENTNVLSVKQHRIIYQRTADREQPDSKEGLDNSSSRKTGVITAGNIVFATHYPFLIIPGFYFLRQHQERSYVLALEGDGVPRRLSGIYYGIGQGGLSFRSAEGKLLLGGGSRRTGKKECACAETGYSYLRKQAQTYYPKAQEKACWAAQDCMTHDRIPFIGKYSVFRPYWYTATGFGKWGMTASMLAALIISDMICGSLNPYQGIFSPQRFLLRAGIKNFLIDAGESAAGLTKGFFGGKQTRCTHMGCRLTWNEEERSWDCPCHGSRYDEKKNVLDNPAQPESSTN